MFSISFFAGHFKLQFKHPLCQRRENEIEDKLKKLIRRQ